MAYVGLIGVAVVIAAVGEASGRVEVTAETIITRTWGLTRLTPIDRVASMRIRQDGFGAQVLVIRQARHRPAVVIRFPAPRLSRATVEGLQDVGRRVRAAGGEVDEVIFEA